jgi:hypothetical protein
MELGQEGLLKPPVAKVTGPIVAGDQGSHRGHLCSEPVELLQYILTLLHSLTGPVGQPFASCLGGQRPGDAPTLPMELGSPVSDASPPDVITNHLATIGPLTSATGCFSHPCCPVPFYFC